MTQHEKIDAAVRLLAEAAPASVLIALLAALFVLFFLSELFSEATVKFALGAIVVTEAVFLLFCAAMLLYLRIYLPLQGVA